MSRIVQLSLLVACVLLLGDPAFAKDPQRETPPAATEGQPAPGTAAPQCVRPRDLMSAEELQAHRDKMRSLTTTEEKAAYRKETRAMLEARAAKRGLPLCGRAGGRGPGPGMGPGMGGGMGPGMGRGPMGPGGPPPTGGTAPPAGQSTPTPETPPPSPPAGGGAPPQ